MDYAQRLLSDIQRDVAELQRLSKMSVDTTKQSAQIRKSLLELNDVMTDLDEGLEGAKGRNAMCVRAQAAPCRRLSLTAGALALRPGTRTAGWKPVPIKSTSAAWTSCWISAAAVTSWPSSTGPSPRAAPWAAATLTGPRAR